MKLYFLEREDLFNQPVQSESPSYLDCRQLSDFTVSRSAFMSDNLIYLDVIDYFNYPLIKNTFLQIINEKYLLLLKFLFIEAKIFS